MILQERCRKDPLSYRDDFLNQRRHFNALLTATSQRPSDPSSRLAEVASFMGAVAHCYSGPDASHIAPDIVRLLTLSGSAMHPDIRRALVKLLALLRARGTAEPGVVIPLFFKLLACNDKVLRRMLHGHIVSDIKKLQASGHGSRRQLQTFLFSMVDDQNEVLVKRSLHVLVDLFRKKIWNDAKCVNMIAKACFHPSMPVALIASKFILDSESKDNEPDSDDEDDDAEAPDTSKRTRDGQKASDMWKAYNMTGKKSSKKRKRMERVINRLTRIKSQASAGPVAEHKPGHPALAAMMLLNDPQDFAEQLFSDLQKRRRKESFENRLVLINLISRLIGTHELILFNFYSFLQRYLQPAQSEVTRVLAYLTQACHDKVPSDVLHPILRGLADRFVSERSSPPSVAAGINSIRAICSRVPLAILDEANESKPEKEQESPLLEDLVQYRSSKDKGIMMAARSLIALYREVQPGLLHKKDRGRLGAEAVQKGQFGTAKAYGELQYATGVDGIELLAKNDSDEDSEDVSQTEESDDDDSEAPELEGTVEDGEENEAGSIARKQRKEDDIAAGEHGNAESDVRDRDKPIEQGREDKDEDDEGADVAVENAKAKCMPGRIDEMQILSNEDFAKIRARKAAKAMGGSARARNTGDAVDPDDLQGPLKRERQTLAERLESVMQGREGREKFGSRKGLNKGGGSTNKKKLKTKSNSMVIHKRRKRSKNMSRRERQLSKRKKNDYR